MTTPYKLLRELCGLSQREAAQFHAVSIETVKSWDKGRNNAKPSVMDELRQLNDRIEAVVDGGQRLLDGAPLDGPLILTIADTDDQAQQLGLPFASCHRRAMAYLVHMADVPVELVPRSQTNTA